VVKKPKLSFREEQSGSCFAAYSQQFNEIMPCIYSQFMEKEARQWRQIYKASHRSGVPLVLPLIVGNLFQALQLLEYLIKHGSERVVDDARSHVSTLKMLRSFHYIDEKGKDQGLNGSFSRLRMFRLFNIPAL
jgi:epsin